MHHQNYKGDQACIQGTNGYQQQIPNHSTNNTLPIPHHTNLMLFELTNHHILSTVNSDNLSQVASLAVVLKIESVHFTLSRQSSFPELTRVCLPAATWYNSHEDGNKEYISFRLNFFEFTSSWLWQLVPKSLCLHFKPDITGTLGQWLALSLEKDCWLDEKQDIVN